MGVEGIHIDLADPILAQIQLSELPELLQMLDFHDFIVACMEDLQLLQRAILQPIQILKLIAGYIKEL